MCNCDIHFSFDNVPAIVHVGIASATAHCSDTVQFKNFCIQLRGVRISYMLCATHTAKAHHRSKTVPSSVLTQLCISQSTVYRRIFLSSSDKCKSFTWKIFNKLPTLQSAHALL